MSHEGLPKFKPKKPKRVIGQLDNEQNKENMRDDLAKMVLDKLNSEGYSEPRRNIDSIGSIFNKIADIMQRKKEA
jgi:hypothetical protein